MLEANGKENSAVEKLVANARNDFEKEMDEDFNLPNAWASLYDFLSKMNSLLSQKNVSKKNSQTVLKFLQELDSIFGIFEFEKKETSVPKDVLALVEKRSKFKKEKNFAEADKLREEIRKKGFELFDSSDGVKVKKA